MSVEKWPFWLKIGRVGRVGHVACRYGDTVSCNYAVMRKYCESCCTYYTCGIWRAFGRMESC